MLVRMDIANNVCLWCFCFALALQLVSVIHRAEVWSAKFLSSGSHAVVRQARCFDWLQAQPAGVTPDYTLGNAVSPWFYAGADVSTVLRLEAIPGRVYYASDGTTVQNPFDALQSARFNAVRVSTNMTCAGPTPPFDNSGDVLARELLFELDFGCIDVQVQTAQQAKSRNMQIVLAINLGPAIPESWLAFSYTQVQLPAILRITESSKVRCQNHLYHATMSVLVQ